MALYIHTELSYDGILTHFAVSSSMNAVKCNFSSKVERGRFETVIKLIKQVPSGLRDYNPVTKIWTMATLNFSAVINVVITAGLVDKIIPHPSLINWISGVSKPISEDDFFYNTAPPPSKSAPTLVELEKSLLQLFDLPKFPSSQEALVKAYRKAAFRYHPDKNNGDSAKMTELNSIWQQYKELVK